jgi:hypothetical protein
MNIEASFEQAETRTKQASEAGNPQHGTKLSNSWTVKSNCDYNSCQHPPYFQELLGLP